MSHANVAVFVPHGGCPHRCVFCDQRRISGAAGIPSDEEVRRVLTQAAANLGERRSSAEIAFFGGSFTAIPRNEMLRLLEAARPFVGKGGFGGIRVSTRPDAVDDPILELLREYGVTAVELGVQSMDDRVLAACGRGHTAHQVAEASRRVRTAGFELGLQMMTGLPGAGEPSDRATADALADLEPDTVRIYPTLVLERTPLAALWRAGEYAPQTLAEAVSLCGELLERFTARGIRVIRLGLHDAPSLRENRLAGPYHPAFRELAEGEVLLRKALALLEGMPKGNVVLTVFPGGASRMAGHRRTNTLALEKRGYRVRIRESADLLYLEVRVDLYRPHHRG